jgi:hypothetical protein
MPRLKNAVHESLCRDVAGGMSREAAWRAHGFGSRNSTRFFNRPKIAGRVKELQAEFNEGAKLQLAYLQESLLLLSKADPGNYFEKAPHSSRLRVKDITSLPPEVRACISDVMIGKDGIVNIKLHDKVKILEALARTIVGPDVSVATQLNVNLGARLDAAIGRFSPEDQRVLADALEALSGDSDGTGDRPATDGDGRADGGDTGPELVSR